MSTDLIAILGFVALFALMLLRVPVGMAMGLVGVSGFACIVGAGPALKIVGHTSMRTVTDYTFGAFDLLKVVSTHPGLGYARADRWQYFGLVNEPCFEPASGPDKARYDLWLDQRSGACASTGGNQPPVISGTPSGHVTVGTAYGFTPAASDPEGATLAFSIANKPPWASFSATTGRLAGTPTAAAEGVHVDIVIRVSDGKSTAELPAFSIEVAAGNTAPSIAANTIAPKALLRRGYNFANSATPPRMSVVLNVWVVIFHIRQMSVRLIKTIKKTAAGAEPIALRRLRKKTAAVA